MKRFATFAVIAAVLGFVAATARANIDTWVLSGPTKIDSGTPCPDGAGYNSGDTINFVDNGGGSLDNNDGSVGGGNGGGNLAQAYLYQWGLTHVNFALSDLSNSYIAGANLSGHTCQAGQFSMAPTSQGDNFTSCTLSRNDDDNYGNRGSSYRSCSFRNANFNGATANAADFTGADFTGANLAARALPFRSSPARPDERDDHGRRFLRLRSQLQPAFQHHQLRGEKPERGRALGGWI